MIDLMKKYFGKSGGNGPSDQREEKSHDIRIATCALFLEMSNIDGEFSEGEKERIQLFQGIVIKISRAADGGNFTVRRVAYGVGVERTYPFQSPLVAKVEVVRHGKTRRAKLFYLRGLSGKAARIKEKRVAKEKK